VSGLARLFRPESVALVGVPRGFKAGRVFLLGLQDQGFAGPIHLVHPSAAEIDGLPCHPSLSRIPGPVDPEGIEAAYADGLLTVRLKRRREPRNIPVDIKA